MSWEPDAHTDPHVWLATLGGHLSIGVALWLAFAWLGPWWAVGAAAVAYVVIWEIPSARRWGLLLLDSILDWVGVTFGAMTGAYIWHQQWDGAAWCVASCIVIAIAGSEKRRD